MTQYEIYVFILCAIVFILLTTASVVCLSIIMKLSLKLIRSGVEDEAIAVWHEKQKHKKCGKVCNAIGTAFSCVVCLVLVAVFICSVCVKNSEKNFGSYRVVKTGSMSQAHEDNTYIQENGLTDQIQTFDLIRIHPLPAENELNIYDIVVYELDGISVVHRIVGIEEPDESHPDKRYFLLQGDNVESPDRFPVLYEQMRGIYRGERMPFVGSFILFMQSPAGWLCVGLVLAAMIATPWMDNKLDKERKLRLLKTEETPCG